MRLAEAYSQPFDTLVKLAAFAADDVNDAFQYYMAHYNHGRPFFLMGHSQGSQMLIELLKHGMTDEQLKIYSTIGGTPHLDSQYTVFGEVEEGLDVVEQIQQTATGRGDRPVDDIEMRITVLE